MFNCSCLTPYKGLRCEILDYNDFCSNLTCSFNGYCEFNSITLERYCKCFSSYSGDNCEIESKEIQLTKSVITTASIIAIIIIVVFYTLIILMDLAKLLTKKKKYLKRKDFKHIVKPIYVHN